MSTPAQRIDGYDAARALAIFGMIVVNFKIVLDASDNGPRWLVATASLFEGRASALFVMLAGVGLSLLSRRERLSEDRAAREQRRRQILRRSAFLLGVGLLMLTIWPADILHFYSVYLLIGALALYAPDRHLLQGALAAVMAFTLLFVVVNYDTGWDWETLAITDFWTPLGFLRSLFYNGFHPVLPWVAFMLFGMWLGRQDVTAPQVRRWLVGIGLGSLVSAEGLSALLIAVSRVPLGSETAQAVFGRNAIPPMPLYVFSAGGSALLVILLMLHIGQRVGGQRWWRALTVTGQYALTVYVAHVWIGMGLLEVLGWLDSPHALAPTLGYALAFYLLSIGFARRWARTYRRGPFEALMRRVTD